MTNKEFNRDQVIAEVFGFKYEDPKAAKRLAELAEVLGEKVRDTEINRAAAEKLMALVGILPEAAVKAAAKEMLETGLMVAERERITELNGSIKEWTEVAEQHKADIKSLKAQIEEHKLKAEMALAKVAEANEAIAKIYTDADLTVSKPKTVRSRAPKGEGKGRRKSSELSDAEREAYNAKRREYQAQRRAKAKAEAAA